MITPTDMLQTISIGIVVVGCVYCIWNGRKIMKKWIDQSDATVVRINRATDVAWKDDDDNPANWYLKDSKKFKVIK